MDKYENRAMELESGIAAFETKNFAHAIKLLSPIADEGNVDALYRMAIMLQNGLGCMEDTDKAYEFMLKSAHILKFYIFNNLFVTTENTADFKPHKSYTKTLPNINHSQPENE